jgi:4-hydroxy-3-polyprenylbenzoate decarboxylase
VDAADIVDLRTALEFLATVPGQLVRTREPVGPAAELAGVYRLVGAGPPVAPPAPIGPAMIFETVKGFCIAAAPGILGSRLRTALLMGSTPGPLTAAPACRATCPACRTGSPGGAP